MELKDWLNSINQTKKNLIDEAPSVEKDYPPYIINRCMSGHLDAIMFANEMNMYNFLPKKMQYDFFINILRTKKRFSPWLRKDTIKDIDPHMKVSMKDGVYLSQQAVELVAEDNGIVVDSSKDEIFL